MTLLYDAMIGADLLGDEAPAAPGFDWNFLVNLAAEGVKKGVQYGMQKDEAKKAAELVKLEDKAAEEQSRKAIDADRKVVGMMVAAALASPGAAKSAAEAALNAAIGVQSIAASKLTPGAAAKRAAVALEDANTAVEEAAVATAALALAPNDKAKQAAARRAAFKVQAAQQVAARASGGGFSPFGFDPAQAAAVRAVEQERIRSESWTRHFTLRNVGIGVGVVGVLGGLTWYLFKRRS